MLSTQLLQAVNDQIRFEIQSAYSYLAMSAYCESANLPGCAKWLRMQWEEELEHAMKFFDLVNARGSRVTLQGIDKPAAEFTGVRDVFTKVLAHEQKVTASIHNLRSLAAKENDYAAQLELDWFVKEQVEEEKHAAEILAMLDIAGESGPALLMLDRQLGARTAG